MTLLNGSFDETGSGWWFFMEQLDRAACLIHVCLSRGIIMSDVKAIGGHGDGLKWKMLLSEQTGQTINE